jgi:hypothetical protein
VVKAVNIVIVVLCGIVGGWIGYWIGHAAGWSVNADWPGQIGGGTGAILLSMGMSVLFVALAAVVVFLVPQRGVRRVLRSGVPAKATVIGMSETGAVRWARKGTRHQVTCELEVCPADGTPYRARAVQFVSEAFEDGLRPGATIAVRVDPDVPKHVALDETLPRAA